MKLDNSVVANLLNTLQNINKDNIILTPEELLNLIKAIKKTYSKKNYRNENDNVDIDDSDLTEVITFLNQKYKYCKIEEENKEVDVFEHPNNINNFKEEIEQIVELSFKNKETEKVFGIGLLKDATNFRFNSESDIKSYNFRKINLNVEAEIKSLGDSDEDFDDIKHDHYYYSKLITNPEEKIKRDINDKITEFVSNNFFKDKKSRLLYIDLIIQTIDTMSSKVQKIKPEIGDKLKLILKGGIALRMVVQELFRDFYGELTDDLLLDFKKDFKISDFDFELLSFNDLNMEIDDYIKFKNQLDFCTYLVIIRLQSYLDENKDYYFDFFKYNEDAQNIEYNKLKYNINSDLENISRIYKNYKVYGIEPSNRNSFTLLASFKDQFKSEEQTKRITNDSFIIANFNNFLSSYFDENDSNKMLDLVKYKSSSFYSTHNPLITYKAENNIAAFSLNRIKFNFKATFKRNENDNEPIHSNMVGEILDISHAWPHDRHNYLKQNKYIKKYNLSNSNYKFTSYSYEGFVKDIFDILFYETDNKPWTDIKYNKRLKRAIILILFMYTQKEILLNKNYSSFISRVNLFDQINELIKNDFNNNDLKNKIKSNLNDSCGILEELINLLEEVTKHKNSDKYNEYKTNISNIFNRIICTLIQHWKKTREPFLTNSNIDTGILNIDFYHLYE